MSFLICRLTSFRDSDGVPHVTVTTSLCRRRIRHWVLSPHMRVGRRGGRPTLVLGYTQRLICAVYPLLGPASNHRPRYMRTAAARPTRLARDIGQTQHRLRHRTAHRRQKRRRSVFLATPPANGREPVACRSGLDRPISARHNHLGSGRTVHTGLAQRQRRRHDACVRSRHVASGCYGQPNPPTMTTTAINEAPQLGRGAEKSSDMKPNLLRTAFATS